jgi:hypothetical protein
MLAPGQFWLKEGNLMNKIAVCGAIPRALSSAAVGLAVMGTATNMIGPAVAQDAKAISASQPTNKSGFQAEIVESKRKNGVLSVRMIIRNTTNNDDSITVISSRNYDNYYVIAGAKKYFIFRDSEKTPVSAQADGFGNLSARIAKHGTWTWWAKYPAPPTDQKSMTYYTPLTPPFDDVPISD